MPQHPIPLPKATYRQLGASGLRISLPILGAMGIGDPRWAPWILPQSEALPLLKAAWDRGINTWDTANVYSNGVSEELIAKAIKTYGIPRHKVVIMTKCCGAVREGNDERTLALEDIDQTADYVNQRGLSRQAIFNAVDASLRRLETGYIDLLQIHRYDPMTPVEETMKALHDLVERGKVRYIGASSMWAVEFAQMQWVAEKYGWTKFWGPLAQGSLARPFDHTGKTPRSEGRSVPDNIDAAIISRVQVLATKKDWPMSHVALAWINQRVSSPIIGFSSVTRIDEAIAANGKVLTGDEEEFLEELYRPKAVMRFDTSMKGVRPA